MNASYVKNICRSLLVKSTPMEGQLIYGGATCTRQCPGLLQCARIDKIYSPQVCALPYYGQDFWLMLGTIAVVVLMAAIGGWALGSWTQWAKDRRPGKLRRVDAIMELDQIG